MADQQKEPCVQGKSHCWHRNGGYTNGNGSGGVDDMQCCWCGQLWRRAWSTRPHPEHGGNLWVPVLVKVYDDGEVPE